MAQTYTRQSSFADGDTITAALFNDEYNQLVNAFAYSSSSASSTGHRHDGTAGQGGNIPQIGDLDFLNKIVVDDTNNRWGFYVEVSSAAVEQIRLQDGALLPVTDSDVDLGTSSLYFKDAYIDSITTTGNVSVGGNLTVTGTTTFNGGTITMGDAATDNVVFGADVDSNIIPDDDNTYDLGSSSQEWKDLYIDGTANIDTLSADTAAIGDLTSGRVVLAGTSGELEDSANLTFDGSTLALTGAATVSTNLTVSGNTTLGNAATDTVTVTADVASNLIPSADSTYSLGDSSNYWSHGYIDAITTTGNVSVGGNLTVTGTTTFNGGTLTLGDAADDNVVFGADVNSNIIPNTDNTYDLGSSSQEWKDLYVDGVAYLDGINFNGTAITSTAAELNILDGVTSTTAELNILDGVTSTAAELNILDGVTSTATELNIVDGDTSATSTTLADADRVVVNDAGTMVQVALTDFETYFESALDTLSNVTTVGALNAGSITSGFGAIDNGSSAITTTGTVTYGSLSDGTITITAFVDEDNMASDSATLVPTQQSVKAYVDAQVTAQDLDLTTDSGTIAIDLDSETLTITGGTGIDTSAATNTVTLALDLNEVTTETSIAQDDFVTMVDATDSGSGKITFSNLEDTIFGNVSGDIAIAAGGAATIQANSVALGTDTTGDYVGTVTAGTGLTSTGATSGEGIAHSLSVDASQTQITAVGTLSSLTVSGDVTVDTSTLKVDSSNNRVGIGNASPDVSLDLGSNTDAIHVPVGNTAARPGSPAAGYFRYNSETQKFEGYTTEWGAIAGGGSGTNMDTNIYTGDGSTTAFTLSTAPDTENNLMVFIDGVFQAQNVYSVSGTTLTFATAPASSRVITVYHSTTTVGGSNNSIATMTGDGSDTTLTLSTAPVHENNVQVYFDGVYQSKSNYSISGTTLTFSTAPPSGVAVEAITATNTSITTATQLSDADGDTLIQTEESSDEDKIRFDTGGSERMIIDNSGNVGIGTTSPSHQLDVRSSSTSADNFLTIGNSDNTKFLGLYGGTSSNALPTIYADSTSTALRFAFADDTAFNGFSEKMRIDSNGKVGIGTTSPTKPLHVVATSGYPIARFQEDGASLYSKLDVENANSTAAVVVMGTGGGSVGNSSWANNAVFGTTSDAKVVLLQNDSAAVTIDTDQNVGIGASPTFTNGSGLEIERAGIATLRLTDTGSGGKSFEIFSDDGTGYQVKGLGSGMPMIFSTVGTERMRIDSSGNILVGVTSRTGGKIFGQATPTVPFIETQNSTTGATHYAMFFRSNGGTQIGYIKISNTGTEYNTGSDYRLKENVRPIENGLERLNNLNPVKFDWKEDGTSSEGFIAHEAQEVFPDAVSGEKDGEIMQGMDYGRITPLLVKAIQEQQEQIEQLKAEIQTLKGE